TTVVAATLPPDRRHLRSAPRRRTPVGIFRAPATARQGGRQLRSASSVVAHEPCDPDHTVRVTANTERSLSSLYSAGVGALLRPRRQTPRRAQSRQSSPAG